MIRYLYYLADARVLGNKTSSLICFLFLLGGMTKPSAELKIKTGKKEIG